MRVKESERIVDEILKSPVVVAKVRSILRKHAQSSPKVVQRACKILRKRSIELNQEFKTDSDSDSSSTTSQSDVLSIAASQLSSNSTEDTTFEFRLLEKHIKPMDVDIEDGHVKSVRIEV